MRRRFTYSVPGSVTELQPGQRLLVPFGRARRVGFYLGPAAPPDGLRTKAIVRVIDQFSYLPPDLFALCIWMADYYFANPFECLAAALPPMLKGEAVPRLEWSATSATIPAAVRRLYHPGRRLSPTELKALKAARVSLSSLIEAGIVLESWPRSEPHGRRPIGYRAVNIDRWPDYFSNAKISPRPFDGIRKRTDLVAEGWSSHYLGKACRDEILETVREEDTAALFDMLAPRRNVGELELTEQQATVLKELRDDLTSAPGNSQVYLLHGITGSGKTLIYCHLAREIIKSGRTVLVMTPEIALTGTTLAYFRGLFGDRVTVLHSAMTDRERLLSFEGIRQGKYDIVIGPRSAVLAPLANIGLIVVDEEHDGSYKQDDPSPRFHGRDCAIMRGKIGRCPVLLGSASPSVDSYYRALTGKYRLLELTSRPAGASLPRVEIVDMKSDRLRGDLPFLSWPMKREVDRRLKDDEQVILFLNRRGYSPQLKCGRCGDVPTCPNCRVKLTYHKVGRKLSCHYCGWIVHQPDTCPKCGSVDFMYVGAGTQKVEESIPRLFDGARAVRLDSDAATSRRRIQEILNEFESGRSNLLLGTQMVTKGLDLPRVTLVGVLSADLMLDLPDFRASERTFAQLLQVAGRSGRADRPGEVIIQTYYPDHDVIKLAAAQQYRSFYDSEIGLRRDLSYPPFSRLINFIISGPDEKRVEEAAEQFRDALIEHARHAGMSLAPLGPAACPMYFMRGNFRRHLFVKTNAIQALGRMLTGWEDSSPRFGLPSTIKIVVDVDPDNMM